ncbi:MAG TPA: addiction module protein [Gemmataceae bacterium]|nr:addiction module protein [Gemmataceae bacterium]
MDKTALLNAMDAWTVEERLDFIDTVYERLATTGSLPLPDPETWTEIERRLADHANDPDGVLTWEQVEARLKAKR